MDQENNKKIYPSNAPFGAVIIFFALLFVFAKWGPAIPFSVSSQSRGEPMVVSGEGKAFATPDIAKINAGVQLSGENLKQVQDKVNQKSQMLLNSLKNLGVEEKDIRTTSYNVYPTQDYTSIPPKITGYQVSTNYEITIRNLDKVNDTIATLTQNGANMVGGITFDLSDDVKKKTLDTARADAVSKAKETAESLSKASGISLGKIINITETNSAAPRPFYALEAKTADGAGQSSQPSIEPGTSQIDLTVSISYEIR
jgi:uncharacterized protein